MRQESYSNTSRSTRISKEKASHDSEQTALEPERGLLKAVALAGCDLLTEADWQGCTGQLLRHIVEASGAARGCIFQVTILGSTAQANIIDEWSPADPGADRLTSISLEEHGLGRWVELLGSGQVICCPVAELPPGEREVLGAQEIIAVAAAPIIFGDSWWGFLWLEDRQQSSPWSPELGGTLGSAARLIAAAIQRCRSEHGLWLRSERLHRLAEAADEGLVIHDAGLIVDTNETFERIFGYERGQLLGTHLEALIPPEHRENVSRLLVEAEDRPHEAVAVRRDGSPVVCLITSKPFGGEPGLKVAVVRDITRRKRTEQQLVIQKIRFEQLFENMPLAILMGDAEDRILNVNRAFEHLFGYSRDEAMGTLVNELIVPAGCENEATRLSSSTLSGEVGFIETERRRKDGRLVPVEIYGVPVVLHDTAEAVFGIYVDRTEHRRAELALKESEERFRSLAEQSLQGIFVWSSGRMIFVNQRLSEITGYSIDEILGWSTPHLEQLIHPTDREYVLAQIQDLEKGAASARPPHAEYRMITKRGELRWVLQHCRSIHFKGEPAVEGVMIDITKRKQAEEQLRHTALHDILTGLANRALFYDRVELALSKRRSEIAFAVLFLDLDRFKVVNDSLGHATGDQLLVQIGRRLSSVVRPGDTVARLGGDEFTVLVSDIRDSTDAARVAERIKAALGRPFMVGHHEVFSSASIGIALSSTGYTSAQEMVRDADIAMYRAKAQGRARHAVFDPEMHTRAVELLRLETDLRRAVERQEFILEYQPIFSLTSSRLVCLEALLRWRHPDRGLLLPAEFLQLAEETGLIMPISEWVLRQACLEAAGWPPANANQKAPAVAINLFSRQISRPELVTLVKDTLLKSGLEGSRLQLEITESAMIDEPERAIEVFDRLRRLDIRLSLDDFGTGYSSLGYLQRMPVDTLKIDRTFVSKLDDGGSSRQIVEAIVALAHNLGMAALGEGIETPSQLSRLRSLGCDYGQGYLFSQSISALQARSLILEDPALETLMSRPIAPARGSRH